MNTETRLDFTVDSDTNDRTALQLGEDSRGGRDWSHNREADEEYSCSSKHRNSFFELVTNTGYEVMVFGTMSLAIRTSVPPLSLMGRVRAVVRDMDPKLPIARVGTMGDIVARATAPERFMTLALSLAAMIALFLVAVGTYGLVAYAVNRRTHELGVRIALGASDTRVRRLVLRQGAALALAGIAIGVAAVLAAGGVIHSLLYEVGAADPATLTATSLVLFVVVLLAVDVPARRAARLDPIEALRHE